LISSLKFKYREEVLYSSKAVTRKALTLNTFADKDQPEISRGTNAYVSMFPSIVGHLVQNAASSEVEKRRENGTANAV